MLSYRFLTPSAYRTDAVKICTSRLRHRARDVAMSTLQGQHNSASVASARAQPFGDAAGVDGAVRRSATSLSFTRSDAQRQRSTAAAAAAAYHSDPGEMPARRTAGADGREAWARVDGRGRSRSVSSTGGDAASASEDAASAASHDDDASALVAEIDASLGRPPPAARGRYAGQADEFGPLLRRASRPWGKATGAPDSTTVAAPTSGTPLSELPDFTNIMETTSATRRHGSTGSRTPASDVENPPTPAVGRAKANARSGAAKTELFPPEDVVGAEDNSLMVRALSRIALASEQRAAGRATRSSPRHRSGAAATSDARRRKTGTKRRVGSAGKARSTPTARKAGGGGVRSAKSTGGRVRKVTPRRKAGNAARPRRARKSPGNKVVSPRVVVRPLSSPTRSPQAGSRSRVAGSPAATASPASPDVHNAQHLEDVLDDSTEIGSPMLELRRREENGSVTGEESGSDGAGAPHINTSMSTVSDSDRDDLSDVGAVDNDGEDDAPDDRAGEQEVVGGAVAGGEEAMAGAGAGAATEEPQGLSRIKTVRVQAPPSRLPSTPAAAATATPRPDLPAPAQPATSLPNTQGAHLTASSARPPRPASPARDPARVFFARLRELMPPSVYQGLLGLLRRLNEGSVAATAVVQEAAVILGDTEQGRQLHRQFQRLLHA